MDRRGFVGSLSLLLGSAATPAVVESLGSADVPRDSVGVMVWMIEFYGAAIVAAAIVDMDQPWSVADLKRRLNRDRQRQRRHAQAAARRESHAGNEVLYRGPLRLWQQFDGRICRSSHNRSVLVGETDREYRIVGIGIACPAGYVRAESVAGVDHFVAVDVESGELLWDTRQPVTRDLVIPRGSRVLVDLRHDLTEVMTAEVVRTNWGQTRLHIWRSQGFRDGLDTCPELRGGVVYDAPNERVVGLLGLPIGDSRCSV